MYKIAVVGAADSVIGFKALGLDTFAVENGEEAKKLLLFLMNTRLQAELKLISSS